MDNPNQENKQVETTEEQEVPLTFGTFSTQKFPDEVREDIEQTRMLFAAVLDLLHLTLGGNNRPTAQVMLQTAITQVMTAQLWTEKALVYSDFIGTLPTDSEPENEPEKKED